MDNNDSVLSYLCRCQMEGEQGRMWSQMDNKTEHSESHE